MKAYLKTLMALPRAQAALGLLLGRGFQALQLPGDVAAGAAELVYLGLLAWLGLTALGQAKKDNAADHTNG